MIVSLLLGRKGSVGFPGKNTYPIFGKPLSWYVIDAAKKSGIIDRHFLSTDDPALKALARENSVEVIDRPDYLCTKEALGEDAYKHGYEVICERIGRKPELLVLLFCNAPTFTPEHVRMGVQVLRERPELDSAVTVSKYNMFSPTRARRINGEGCLDPFVPFEKMNAGNVNCDRDSQGDVWFADVALSIVRPGNLDRLHEGLLPQKWMGKKIFPLENVAGLDVDFEWQMPQVEWWLKKRGYGL